MLRQPLLLLARSDRVKALVSSLPVTSGIVARYVPGESVDDAVAVVERILADGQRATLDLLGEDTSDTGQAESTVAAYLELLAALAARGLADRTEVSLKLSAVGMTLAGDGEAVALGHARTICRAARDVGTMVTLDMEDHTTTETNLRILGELRTEYPETGAVLQAYLKRTEADCADLAVAGSRVRLCKGAYAEPATVAYQSRLDVDRSYVRCLRILFEGDGYPMVATHDPRMVAIAEALARKNGRRQGDYEFQMLFGVRPEEQRRLAEAGETVRVYVPYGQQWYGYLMRRLAERPANLRLFLRSLVSTR